MPLPIKMQEPLSDFFSGATECEIDKQGRILIPANLRAMHRWKKMVVIGVFIRVDMEQGYGRTQ